jgi:hypothetical protein
MDVLPHSNPRFKKLLRVILHRKNDDLKGNTLYERAKLPISSHPLKDPVIWLYGIVVFKSWDLNL